MDIKTVIKDIFEGRVTEMETEAATASETATSAMEPEAATEMGYNFNRSI
jgi:uncharacterized protein YbjQ (UPF0145 family)